MPPSARSDRHYVSPFNFQGLPQTWAETETKFYDSTLRKALLLPGGRLRPELHVTIAEYLRRAGVTGVFYNFFYDRKKLATDSKALENQLAASAVGHRVPGLRKIACLYARPSNFDPKEACDLAFEAGMTVLELGIPISDVEMQADLPGLSRQETIDALVEGLAYCKGLGAEFAANLTDVGRSEPDHLLNAVRSSVAAGAKEVRLSDSYSSLSPDGVRNLVRFVRTVIPDDVKLMVHIHDDYGVATAATVTAAMEGCDVDCTVSGLGDKGGFAAFEEVALTLALLYGKPIGVKLDHLAELARVVERETGIQVAPTKAVIGRDIFNVENDYAVARLLRSEYSFLDPGARVVSRTYDPAIVGRARVLIWGQTSVSGLATREKLKQMGLADDDKIVKKINDVIRTRVMALDRYPCWVSEQDVEDICRSIAS